MDSDHWDPDLYERFAAERTRPFDELLGLLEPSPGGHVVDLGCGTGALTRRLHEHLGAGTTVGVDNSPAMLARAAEQPGFGLTFSAGDLAEPSLGTRGGPFDVVHSNAALHWVEDHPGLLPRLAALLAPGGQLAFQVPANHEHPSQTVAAEVAAEEPFAAALDGYQRRSPVLEPEAYALALHDLGLTDLTVSARVYLHLLPSPTAVVDWVRGTTLTDYQRRLPEDVFGAFLARYAAALTNRLPRDGAGRVAFTFRRILVHGRLPAA